jgi:lysophospholipase L1-like esterase
MTLQLGPITHPHKVSAGKRNGPSYGVLCSVMALAFLLTVLLTPLAASAAVENTDGTYLALGDSIAFGFNPHGEPRNTESFKGYPSLISKNLDLKLTNAACSGETSGHFVSLSNPDNGCQPWHTASRLHTNYTTTQLDFAVNYLQTHPDTQLVTINIGANDLYYFRDQCITATPTDPTAIQSCIEAGVPGVLASVAANLSTIYQRIRLEAGYTGELVALTYYSTNYTDFATTAIVQALNQVITGVTLVYGGKVADGYGAFYQAAAPYGGDPCAAGLLIRLTTSTCDVHPSQTGHRLLAEAILRVV